MSEITFKNSEFLFLLMLIIPLIGWYIFKLKNTFSAFSIPFLKDFRIQERSFNHLFIHVPFLFRIMAIILLILAMARPQIPKDWRDITSTGIDIVMAMDISSSMLAKDFGQSRLEASKEVARNFIKARKTDRIGVVAFSGESFTLFPLTTDYDAIINLFYKLQPGMITDGTAIGMGLATSAKNLRESQSKSKVIILLTDGANNAGSIDPMEAAEFAKSLGIRVYTISIRNRELSAQPIENEGEAEAIDLNPNVLQDIAKVTGGEYFSTSNKEKLIKIYEEIDLLEKSKMTIREYGKKEAFIPFAFAAGLFLIIELLIKYFLVKIFP